MRPPTPATMSIIIVLSGSTSTLRPTLKLPLWSHVHAVYVTSRRGRSTRASAKNDHSPPANATNTLTVEIQPAARRESRVPPRRMSTVATSGANRQIQAPLPITRAAPTARRRRG